MPSNTPESEICHHRPAVYSYGGYGETVECECGVTYEDSNDNRGHITGRAREKHRVHWEQATYWFRCGINPE